MVRPYVWLLRAAVKLYHPIIQFELHSGQYHVHVMLAAAVGSDHSVSSTPIMPLMLPPSFCHAAMHAVLLANVHACQHADQARYVNHVDDHFIQCVTALYRQRIPNKGRVLDMMSSHVSHLPKDNQYAEVVGHGMNAQEVGRVLKLECKDMCRCGISSPIVQMVPGSSLLFPMLLCHASSTLSNHAFDILQLCC